MATIISPTICGDEWIIVWLKRKSVGETHPDFLTNRTIVLPVLSGSCGGPVLAMLQHGMIVLEAFKLF